jgi:hypothetical protein
LPGWAAASFSPWLFAGVFTQALFYTGLMAADRAARSRRLGSWMFAGVALGFTFLGHTAPALILGAVLVLLALGRMAAREEVQKLPPVRDVGLSLLIALVVSLPLTWSVAVHYRFATLNPAPAAWVFPPTIISNWRSLVDSFSGARGYLALAGILLLAASRTDRRRALVLWLWFSVVALLLATYYASPWLARVGLRVPSILPAFHFVFYAGAALAVLQGYAIWRIARGLARFLASGRVAHGLMLSHLFLAGAVLWCAVVMLPQLRQREDFVDVPRRGKNYAHIAGFNSTREWIDRTTRPGTVFLAADFVGLSVVGPAGGRVVALENLYANPYVRVDDRERARNDMMKAIQAESRDTFCGLADTYHVEYVIGSTADPVRPPSFLSLVHSDEGLNVWAVKGCSTS